MLGHALKKATHCNKTSNLSNRPSMGGSAGGTSVLSSICFDNSGESGAFSGELSSPGNASTDSSVVSSGKGYDSSSWQWTNALVRSSACKCAVVVVKGNKEATDKRLLFDLPRSRREAFALLQCFRESFVLDKVRAKTSLCRRGLDSRRLLAHIHCCPHNSHVHTSTFLLKFFRVFSPSSCT